MNFGRLMTAMVTAFDEKGNLDLDRQTKLIHHLVSTGTETIVVAGTTGESPTLTTEEKLQLFTQTVKESKGKAKVIAGTGNNNTQETIALTKEAEKLGADGIMLVAPYYSRPSQEGLYQHFVAVAKETTLPIMLYNVPGRTSVNMSFDTICRLAQVDNITMIKEASEDIGQMTRIIENTPDDFLLYSGDDSFALPVLAIGGYGVVSVASHVMGEEIMEMISAFCHGNVGEAAGFHQSLFAKCKALFMAPNPVPVKYVLSHMGLEVGSVRLPLVGLNEREKEHIRSYFK